MKTNLVLRKLFLLLTLVIGTGNLFAETSTLVFTAACGGTGTADNGVQWTVSSDAGETSYVETKGIHYGSSDEAVSYLTLSTSAISGIITSIVVNASGVSGTSAVLNVTVGGNSFGAQKSLVTEPTDYTFEGAAKGTIAVSLTQSSAKKALYVKSIVVTYHTSPLSSLNLSGSYPTTFTQGDAFSHEGMTVKAVYEDETEIPVTGLATFSGYNMSSYGEQTVTVSYTENEITKTADYAITVIPATVSPLGPSLASNFSIVKDASTLAEGDEIILVAVDDKKVYALSTVQNENNRGRQYVKIEEGLIDNLDANVQVITLEGSAGAWYLNVGDDAYLYAASNSYNYLRTNTRAVVDLEGKSAITIDSNLASIVFQGSYTHNKLLYNTSNNVFSCYASGDANVYIYRRNYASTFDVTIGSTGWRTLVTSADASLPDGVKAYIVTNSNTSSATLTEVASVKANNPYLLNGPTGNSTLTVIAYPVEPTDNLLQISTVEDGNGNYVLANKSNGVGFYKWTGGSLGIGRVFLPQIAGAREYLSFDESSETTGIENTDCREPVTESFYDLQGRRVAQPHKGLYIVGGKKVLVK